MPLNLPLLKNCSICGVFFGSWAQRDAQSYRRNFDELFTLFEEERLHPVISDTYALQDFRSAFASLSERRANGKVILSIQA